MDKIKGDQNSNGDWNITLPPGDLRPAMPPDEADKYLDGWPRDLEKAIDDVKHWRDTIKNSAAAKKK